MPDKDLSGVMPAFHTLLDSRGSIEFQLFEKQVGYLLEIPSQRFFDLGIAAEGTYFDFQSELDSFDLISHSLPSALTLCVAVLQSITKMVVCALESLQDYSPDFVVVVPPYYGRPSQGVFLSHFREIADAYPVPVVLYGIASGTQNPIAPDTVRKLAEYPRVAGMNDSSANFKRVSQGMIHKDHLGSDFKWIQGNDHVDASGYLIGAEGVVSGLATVRAEPSVEMYAAFKRES